jgi:hypothetical protein
MTIYFTVDLMTLAARCLYLDRLEETLTVRQIEAQIEQFPQRRRPAHPQNLPALAGASANARRQQPTEQHRVRRSSRL